MSKTSAGVMLGICTFLFLVVFTLVINEWRMAVKRRNFGGEQ